jgi:hypothetical protein
MPEVGGALGSLVVWLTGWMVKLGVVAGSLWFAWHCLQVLLSGGSGRAAWRAVFGVLAISVALAALTHLDQVGALGLLVGQRVFDGAMGELRAQLG